MSNISSFVTAVAFLSTVIAGVAHAAQIDTVVNINSLTSGAGFINSPTDLGDPVSPVQLLLGAGTYNLQVVAPMVDPRAQYAGWSRCCGSYYSTAYVVFDSTGKLLMYGGEYLSASSADGAFLQTKTDHLDRNSLTLTGPTTLDFIIPDGILYDNGGGSSVRVLSAAGAVTTPEPTTSSLFGFGLVLAALSFFGVSRRGRPSTRAQQG